MKNRPAYSSLDRSERLQYLVKEVDKHPTHKDATPLEKTKYVIRRINGEE